MVLVCLLSSIFPPQLLNRDLVLCLIRPDLTKDLHDPVRSNVDVKGALVPGGKPPLGPKLKDSSKFTATLSEPHLPVSLGEVGHHREPQPFSTFSSFFDSKVLPA